MLAYNITHFKVNIFCWYIAVFLLLRDWVVYLVLLLWFYTVSHLSLRFRRRGSLQSLYFFLWIVRTYFRVSNTLLWSRFIGPEGGLADFSRFSIRAISSGLHHKLTGILIISFFPWQSFVFLPKFFFHFLIPFFLPLQFFLILLIQFLRLIQLYL